VCPLSPRHGASNNAIRSRQQTAITSCWFPAWIILRPRTEAAYLSETSTTFYWTIHCYSLYLFLISKTIFNITNILITVKLQHQISSLKQSAAIRIYNESVQSNLSTNIHFHIVACRAVATQRPRNKKLYRGVQKDVLTL
jgi:hypothetical protein